MSVLFLDGLCKSKILICTVLILFQSRGRAFLNVVDVHASSILRDIREHDKAKEDEEDEAKPASYLTRDTSPHRMGQFSIILGKMRQKETSVDIFFWYSPVYRV